MRFNCMISLASYLLVGSFTSGCDEEDKKKGTSAKASVAFAQGDSAALTSAVTRYTPSHFGFKLMSVYIQQEKDTTSAPASQIYVNAACESEALETELENDETGGEKKLFQYTGIGNCDVDAAVDFFNLARPIEEVNEELNSQKLPVLPGKYKYVSIGMCQGKPKNPNVTFKADGMDDNEEVILGTCGITSAEIVPPMEIKEGETVTVNLAYNLADIVYDFGEGMTKSDNCFFSTDGGIRRCVDFPALTPSVTKE